MNKESEGNLKYFFSNEVFEQMCEEDKEDYLDEEELLEFESEDLGGEQ